jgi:glycosyltransferase involved in cell wall biosynthesis
MQNKTLIFLSAHDPTDVLNWSGTLYALHQALEKNEAGVKLRYVSGGWPDKLAQQINRALLFIGIKLDCRFSTVYSVCSGLYVSTRLLFMPNGPILAVAASNYAPYLITKRPLIYISDATFRAAARIYSDLKDLPNWLYRQFDRNEALTLQRAKATILPSKWASDSAKVDYGVPPERIFELPFGANISDHLIEEYYTPKTAARQPVNLLFVSADWERKGGDKAIEICRALMQRGIDARLVIIGSAPDYVAQIEFVEAKGFLNKSDPAQLRSICEAYRQAHFFVLPTNADASPIVFSECRAFGVPPVTHAVGGTSSAIDHGRTGLLLGLDASPEQFAEALAPYIQDSRLYATLSAKCRAWYLERAHWSNWSKLVIKLAGLDDTREPSAITVPKA